MTRRLRPTGLAPAALVATLMLAACGSTSSTTTSSGAVAPGSSSTATSSSTSSVSSSTTTAATSSESESSSGESATANAVEIKDFSFQPQNATVKAGATVTWTQGDDGTMHTVTADDNSFASSPLAHDATFTHAFAATGSFPYHCSIHPNMHGVITVTA